MSTFSAPARKTILPIAAGLLILQGIAELMRCVQCLHDGAWPQRMQDVEEMEQTLLSEQREVLAAREHELEHALGLDADDQGDSGKAGNGDAA